MAIEKIYTITNVKDAKSGNVIFKSLFFIALIGIVGLGVWFIYARKLGDKASSKDPMASDSAKSKLAEQSGSKQEQKAQSNITNKKKTTFLRDPPKLNMQDKVIENNGAGNTNIVVGRVIQQRPNQMEIGEPSVLVSYFYGNTKKEVLTDANGNYEIVLPVSAENGIDCKIILYYKKGSLLNTQQTISCNQKNITDIKF
jgi:hypothetical protein